MSKGGTSPDLLRIMRRNYATLHALTRLIRDALNRTYVPRLICTLHLSTCPYVIGPCALSRIRKYDLRTFITLYEHPPRLSTQVSNHQVGNIATPRSYLESQKRCVGKTGPADQKPHKSKNEITAAITQDSNGRASKARGSKRAECRPRELHTLSLLAIRGSHRGARDNSRH